MMFFRLGLTVVGLPVAAYCLSLYTWNWLRRRLLITQTGWTDIPLLGKGRHETDKIKGTVVVCGGSIGGLLAARICHDHFEQVIIVEPEAWLSTSDGRETQAWTQKSQRSRVIQYYSLQAVQVFLFTALKALFPNFEDECIASGIRLIPADFKRYLWGRFMPAPHAKYNGNLPKVMYTSRQGLETILRRMVIGSGYYPNIQWIVGTVTGVTRDSKHPTHLQSVSVRSIQGPQDIEAVLVVDCTGSAGAGVKWIEREGYGFAETYSKDALPLDQLKISYDQKIRYATLEFSIPPELGKRLPIPGGFYTQGSIFTCVARSDKDRCSTYASTLDGDRLQVLCGTWGTGEDPPRTIQATKEYIHAMVLDERPPQWWFDMLDLLTEMEDTMTCSIVRVPPTPYIRFHKATNLPSNWVAIGDSVMRLNPVFGQGCSKAMLDVVSLNNTLRSMANSESKAGSRLPMDFSKRFFAVQEQKIKPLWLATKTFDYGYDTTIPIPGETLSSGAFIRWYMRQVQTLAFTDMDLASTMWHISMMMAPGIDNLHPLTVVKVLWNVVRTHVCTLVGA